MPHNFIFLGFYLLLSKLYLNSYLATLNAREGLRATVDDPKSIHLSDMPRFTSFNFNTSQQYSEPTAVEKSADTSSSMGVSVQTVVKRHMDEESITSDARSSGHGNPQVGAAY
ncbi:hypothetical protein PQX77_004085 [Marasmius sp. AFHP31]|nr:hypothetical protein PQX77_004085 [Marasmius sp. AFHP31]